MFLFTFVFIRQEVILFALPLPCQTGGGPLHLCWSRQRRCFSSPLKLWARTRREVFPFTIETPTPWGVFFFTLPMACLTGGGFLHLCWSRQGGVSLHHWDPDSLGEVVLFTLPTSCVTGGGSLHLSTISASRFCLRTKRVIVFKHSRS